MKSVENSLEKIRLKKLLEHSNPQWFIVFSHSFVIRLHGTTHHYIIIDFPRYLIKVDTNSNMKYNEFVQYSSKIVNLNFMYSEKATKFWKIFTLLLTGTIEDNSKVKISQNFLAFSEYLNFNNLIINWKHLYTVHSDIWVIGVIFYHRFYIYVNMYVTSSYRIKGKKCSRNKVYFSGSKNDWK